MNGLFRVVSSGRGPVLRCGWILAILGAVLGSWGCNTPVGVERAGRQKVFREVTVDALSGGVPSVFSTQALARGNLLPTFEESPEKALEGLHARIGSEDDPRDVFALSELSFLVAEQTGSKGWYLTSLVYAYRFLFPGGSRETASPYNPRFRIACDLYNNALTEFLKIENGDATLEQGVHVFPFGEVDVRVDLSTVPWDIGEFNRLLPAWDFEVRGLRLRNRMPGLGAPLIAVHRPPRKGDPTVDCLSPAAKVAVTALLRLDLQDASAARSKLAGTLQLYDPFSTSTVKIQGKDVPLEGDLTINLAYGLQESKLWSFESKAFLSGGGKQFKSGLYLIHPYTPGKIPVVFVHGTISSPARWAPLLNGLQGHEDIRKNYQFWFFLYASGNPVGYSSNLLRQAIYAVVKQVDPEGKDAAIQQMVVIGHSQGGLLTRMLCIDSGDKIWKFYSDKDFDDVDLPEKDLELLRQIVFFHPVPYIKRAVFISTPHRGSFLADKWYSKLGSMLMSFPDRVDALGDDLYDPKKGILKRRYTDIPTSLDAMEPGSPALQLLNSIPLDPDIQYNSIIPVLGDGPLMEGNDGVVEYKSEHIEGVESELVLRHCGHSCQADPRTAIEVRRILLEHLEESRKPGNSGKQPEAAGNAGTTNRSGP